MDIKEEIRKIMNPIPVHGEGEFSPQISGNDYERIGQEVMNLILASDAKHPRNVADEVAREKGYANAAEIFRWIGK